RRRRGETVARAKPPVVAPAGRQGGQEVASWVTIPRALAYITLVGLAVLFLWLTIRVDLVIFTGVLFGICLRRTAAALRRVTRLPIGWSLLVVVLLILAFFVGMGWFFSVKISSQFAELSEQLPAAAVKVGNMINQSTLGKMLMQRLDIGNFQAFPTTVLQSFFGVAINVVGVVGGIVVIIFVALYVAAESQRYAAGLVLLVPPARRTRAAEILHEAASAMWYWMLGRLFSMSVFGIIVALGLWLLGAPLPVALGFLAGTMIFVSLYWQHPLRHSDWRHSRFNRPDAGNLCDCSLYRRPHYRIQIKLNPEEQRCRIDASILAAVS